MGLGDTSSSGQRCPFTVLQHGDFVLKAVGLLEDCWDKLSATYEESAKYEEF